MILTCNQLFTATENPKINSITLDLLREYYETHLHGFSYQYQITDDAGHQQTLELRFEKENFCHLLGIETILTKSINRRDIPQYKGQLGWDNIQNGTLDFAFLKNKNVKGFKNNKSKFVFFYLIPRVAESPKGVSFDQTKVKTKVECEMLFYDNIQNAYVHFGIEKNMEKGFYVPKTFLVEKITKTNTGIKYIENQQQITVNKTNTETQQNLTINETDAENQKKPTK
jgi:hypothetical protein